MVSDVDVGLANEVVDWIKVQAQVKNIKVTAYASGIVRNGAWLHVPVAVDQEGDAYERATCLQQIEDEWSSADHDGVELLLVPAKSVERSKGQLYAELADLEKRQRQILELIGEDRADYAAGQQGETIK